MTRLVTGFAAALLLLPAPLAQAERVALAPGADLQAAIDASRDGDTLELAAGEYRGPVRLSRSIGLVGATGAMLRGDGVGNVVTVVAPGAVVRGLSIEGSGRDWTAMNAGVFVEQSAAGARVENNRLDDNLYGVYLHGAANAIARGNTILGIRHGRVNEMGNGVSVWNAPGAQVIDNDISYGRDGIFSISSSRNLYRGNRFHDVRFAIHYMYTNDSEISDNVSTGNVVGFALMFSNRLRVTGNVSDHDRDQGLLFNYANDSTIADNAVFGGMQPASRWASAGRRSAATDMHGALSEGRASDKQGGARIGPERCVFIYNANHNKFERNWFEGCEVGIHFTAGSEGNQLAQNSFVGNRTQVKYVGTRNLDWGATGRGNYWSDNPGFDLNGDGIADTAYRPNDLIDRVMWIAPEAKILANSPAVQTIRWAQSQFPALLPGGVIDTRPLMKPPTRSSTRSTP